MPILQKRPRKAEGKIHWLPIEDIRPGKAQPRRVFAQEGIEELAQSIGRYGVLQPLTVRRRQNGYELIAGERRLRAAKLAGLTEVPCLISEANMEEASVLALVENLQRQDLNFWEEAEGISRLVKVFGMSQEEAARRLGKSQSAIANKLRLLRLPSDVLEKLSKEGMSERHGRALLRLPNAQAQRQALVRMVELGMNVAAAERYVDSLLRQEEDVPPTENHVPGPDDHAGQKTFVMKDLRLFYNTVSRSVEMMRRGGIAAEMEQRETPEAITLTISISKGKQMD